MSLHESAIYLKKGTVQRIATTATAGNTALRDDLKGPGWVRIKAVDCNAQVFLSSDDADAVTMDEAANEAEMGWDLLDGQTEDFYMTSETRIVWATDADGYLVVMKTNKNIGK